MPSPIGMSAGYLSDSGQQGPRQNALLRPQSGQGQFSGFDNMDMSDGWFRGNGRWRDKLGRGTVKQQIDLGPMASNNSMLQYNFPKQPSDTNPFTFF